MVSKKKLGLLWLILNFELEDEVDCGQGFIDYKESLGHSPQIVADSTIGNYKLSNVLNIFHAPSLL